MPITLYDEDGNPKEVPSAEEIEALKQSQEEANKKVEELSKQKEELEKDVNPNWKQIRSINQKLKDAIKASGKDVDEEGNVIEKKELKEEDILAKAKNIFQEETFSSEKERLLSSYSEEDKKTMNVYLDKLMSGEEKSISNLHKFFGQAEAFIFPEMESKSKRVAYSPNGHGPNLSNDGKPSESAVKMGSEFGISEKELAEKSDPVIKF